MSAVVEEIDLAEVDPAVWMMGFGWIQKKDRTWEIPTLNIFQLRVCRAYQWCMLNGVPARIIGLKPRRVGGTTVFAGISYHHARNFNTYHVSIANQKDRSNTLFRMLCNFAKKDEYTWTEPGIDNETQTTLELPNGSVFNKETAENPNAARGDTLTSVHASEVAFWRDTPNKNARDVATSLVNAVGDHPSTFVGVESTPKGSGGYFYERWLDAKWPDFEDYWKRYATQPDDQATIWLRVFAAWFEFPEHRLARDQWEKRGVFIDEENLGESLTEREQRGVKKWGWDLEQIAWRRYTLKDKCLNDENRLDEEYPEDPVSAFRASGRPRFDSDGLVEIELRARSINYDQGVLARQDGGPVGFQRTGENEAWVRIWEEPRIGCKYLISADVMGGESETERTEDSDCHSVLVWRASYRDDHGVQYATRLVARIAPPCRLDFDPLADQIDLLSRYYGRCIVIPEINKSGLVKPLRDREVPIFRMVSYQKAKQRNVESLGWHTNDDRRREIVDRLSTIIREGEVDIACTRLSLELATFVINKRGKPEAQSGCKDDDVMSASIGLFNIGAATEYTEAVRQRRLPADYEDWE